MKLLITCTGFSNENLILAAEKALGKSRQNISVAIINEAYTVENGDKSWAIREMYNISEIFPKFVDLVDLLGLQKEEVTKRLEAVDLIYIVGGNTEYLMKVVYESGLDKYLEKTANKLVVGSSAGGMVFCKRPNPKVYGEIFGEYDDYGFENYLEYLPDIIIPHFGEANFPELNSSLCSEIAGKYSRKLTCINNKQGILVVDGLVEYINGEPNYFGA